MYDVFAGRIVLLGKVEKVLAIPSYGAGVADGYLRSYLSGEICGVFMVYCSFIDMGSYLWS